MNSDSFHGKSPRRPRVLVVDDTSASTTPLVDLLGGAYELKFAEHGDQALKLCGNPGAIDIILLNGEMPDMDGFEVCRRLRAEPATKEIPVLFLTAKSERDDIVQGFAAGGNDYLTKPFRPKELQARIRTHLLVRSQRQEIERANRDLRELLHIISHDVSNHFMVLQMAFDLGESSLGELMPMMQAAVRNGINVTAMVRELRRSQDKELLLEPVSLSAAVAESLLLMQTKLAAKEITLVPDVPAVHVQAESCSLVNSVLNNLLTNAIKYSPRGSTIELFARVQGDEVCLTVRDHGIGMTAEVLSHLFDLGKSHSRPGTDGETGTGFGMPLVQRFVTQFGGRLEVTSRDQGSHPEDHGTEFRIWLEKSPELPDEVNG